MKNKGFTLIEMIGVIIILAIVIGMTSIAITNIVSNSRKDTYITTVKEYAEIARGMRAASKFIQNPKNNQALVIPIRKLDIEEGKGYKSPYSDFDLDRTYVIIVNNADLYAYYIAAVDMSGNGIKYSNTETLARVDVLIGSNLQDIKRLVDIKNGNQSITIEGISYRVSSNDYSNSETILLDKVI